MKDFKDSHRSLVRITYDGHVHKTFRGKEAEARFTNEVRILKYLEKRECPNVPRLLESFPDELKIVTTNVGQVVEDLRSSKLEQLFDDLQTDYGVRHDDPFARNITYNNAAGCFCIIDFELAEIVDADEPEFEDQPKAALIDPPATAPQKDSLSWAALTHPGKVRPNNEDAYRLISVSDKEVHILPQEGEVTCEEQEIIMAVSDGMGGANLGQRASNMILEHLGTAIPRAMLTDPDALATGRERLLDQNIRDVHEAINKEANHYEECKGMGATLSTLWFSAEGVTFAHVGDSRIYLHSGGQTQQLSQDHTTVGRLLRTGAISPMQARFHPLRNVLSQAVGAGMRKVTPETGQIETESGDIFLICSDGLTEGITDNAIGGILASVATGESSLAEARDELFNQSMEGSGRDNITIIVALLN